MPIQTIIVRLATPISSGAVHAIDLGLVSIRNAAIYGRTRPLVPYADGRLIKSVSFVPQATFLSLDMYFSTPNTASGGTGIAFMFGGNDLDHVGDTAGLFSKSQVTAIGGRTGDPGTVGWNQILDCGPLIATSEACDNPPPPLGSWQANTPHCVSDRILDDNGHMQSVDTTGGVTGSTQPVFNDTGGFTVDGSVTWFDLGLLPTGEIHAIAEVIEGVSLMPRFAATIEFIAPPSNTVAGETMADVTLIVKDQFGEIYTFTPHDVNLAILGAGTLNGNVTEDFDQVTGIATFNDLSITEPGTYILRALPVPCVSANPIFSDPFDIT